MGSPARLADDTAQGKTTIAASVVQKIAGVAAREISGVYALGGGMSRAFGALRERIPGGGTAVANIAGVQVEVGEPRSTSTSSSSTARLLWISPVPCGAT
jgi:uncharacterized alkaline shock family protein YloU